MAREKGMGNLQREKSGRWTLRVGINGKCISRSTGTTDREKAEEYLQRFLAPLGLGSRRLPLSDVWLSYVMSPNHRELAPSTMESKRLIWQDFARWMEKNHLEIGSLAEVTREAVGEYLACVRLEVCAATYNRRICVLREIFNCLADKASLQSNPWDGVVLHVEHCHSRRELEPDELDRLISSAGKLGEEWRSLILIGIYTGLRLGDACRLRWDSVNLERGIIQLIPSKTKNYANGKPITIPLHPELVTLMIKYNTSNEDVQNKDNVVKSQPRSPYVLPTLARYYDTQKWCINHGLTRIFKMADIETGVKIDGRRKKTPNATFHSLRHTFVSFAANAGVPLPVVQSIVGHCSTAMTRHYYHENEDSLRAAVATIPSIMTLRSGNSIRNETSPSMLRTMPSDAVQPKTIEQRLKQLERLHRKELVSEDEYISARARILAEI